MQLKDYADLSQIFNNEIYKKYFDAGGNVQTALSSVNSFLEEYPCYPEAIIFKARMLIVEDKIDDTLEYLKIAERIDKWRVAYSFDIAEIYIKKVKRKKLLAIWNLHLNHCSTKPLKA